MEILDEIFGLERVKMGESPSDESGSKQREVVEFLFIYLPYLLTYLFSPTSSADLLSHRK